MFVRSGILFVLPLWLVLDLVFSLVPWLVQPVWSVITHGSYNPNCSVSSYGSSYRSARSSFLARTLRRLSQALWLVHNSCSVSHYGSYTVYALSHYLARSLSMFSRAPLARSPHVVGSHSTWLDLRLYPVMWLVPLVCTVYLYGSIRYFAQSKLVPRSRALFSQYSYLDPVTCSVALYISILSRARSSSSASLPLCAQSTTLARCPYVRSPSLWLTRISLLGHRNLVRTVYLLSHSRWLVRQ